MSIGIYYPPKDKFKVPVIVMEKMELSLRNLVEKHDDIDVSFRNTVTILNDVCLGLQYLHSRDPPIVHRDLTPNNILLCGHLRAKITDFGVARTLQATDTTLTQIPGTPDFMPPECLTDKPVYGLPLDIFSVGGVILYITTRQWPTPSAWISFDPNTNEKLTLSEVQRRQQYLDKMTVTYAKFTPLVISCLDDNPNNRPTVVEVLKNIKNIEKTHGGLIYDIWPDTQGKGQQQHHQQIAQQEQQVQPDDQKQKQQLPQENQEQIKQPEKQKLERQQVQQVSPQLQQGYIPQNYVTKLRPPKPRPRMSSYPLYVAKYDYSSEELSDKYLSFKKGDLFYMLNTVEGDWWFARAKHSGQKGYIPNNFVAKANTLEAEE